MKWLAVAIVASGAVSVVANDGYSIETGSALNYSKSKSIQMVCESIVILLDDEKAHIQVDFVFRNHSGKQTVTMAFPDERSNADVPMAVNFRSWVDGVRTQVSFKHLTGNDMDGATGVWTKRVAFGSNQTRKVRVSYAVPHGASNLGDRSCGYILTTGATWRGPISETKIRIDWSGVKKLQAPIVWELRKKKTGYYGYPIRSNWRRTGRSLLGVYRNYVPDFDLDISLLPGFGNYFINGVPTFEGYSPLIPQGDPRDVLYPVDNLGALFAIRSASVESPEDWSLPCTRFFGGTIAFPDNHTMLLGGRRRVRLARPVVTKPGVHQWNKREPIRMAHLKDVVIGIGGSYRFNARTGRVEIKIPK